jgi:hypothetical protein
MSEQARNEAGNEGRSVTVALPKHPSAETGYFTLVFKGHLRDFNGNPLRTETPFGIPVVCGYGDAFEEADNLREELENLTRSLGVPVRP